MLSEQAMARFTEQAARIGLADIAQPFSTSCGGYPDVEWFEDARYPHQSPSHASARHAGDIAIRTIINTRG
jgi:hypothetical protein